MFVFWLRTCPSCKVPPTWSWQDDWVTIHKLLLSFQCNILYQDMVLLNQQPYLAVWSVLMSLLLMPSHLERGDQSVTWRVKCSDRLQPEEGSRGLSSKNWYCHRSYPKEAVFKLQYSQSQESKSTGYITRIGST